MGSRRAAAPGDFLAKGGVYLNVSQFPVDFERYFSWTRERTDIDCVFFLHDLLPIEAPEYFVPPSARGTCAGSRRSRAARARAVVVTSRGRARGGRPPDCAPRATATCRSSSRRRPPIRSFSSGRTATAALARHPYFVTCGTIEPRKNHLLLLHVWRDLVARLGPAAPKLVLIGERGWENEHVIDLLERSPGLQTHVIEASGLPTPCVRRLFLGAQAVLLPSFAEGYGLPLVEALAVGAPVIASDIPVFHEVGKGRALTIDPTDGPAWREAVCAFTAEAPARRAARVERLGGYAAPDWPGFFEGIENFLEELPRGAAALARSGG